MFNNSLIVDKFYQFILPNTAKVFAVCISAFVDALIVATLLGSGAMAIVNLGSPIILAVATLSALFTVGGGTLYASACGAFDKPKADRIFTVATLTAVVVVLLMTMVAFLSRDLIVSLLCAGNKELIDASRQYISILIGSMPVLTVANVLFGFLPSAGKPKLSSMLMLMANVINLGLDVVFIKFLGLGIDGAAYATVCGYAAGLLVYLVYYMRRQLNMSLIRIHSTDFRELKGIFSMGLSASLSQLSFVIKIAFCNSLALYYGGHNALIALSVCMQLLSITSIFVGGIGSSMINITATLRGQKDFSATESVVRKAYTLILICSAMTFIAFWCFAPEIAFAYKAREAEVLQLTVHATRIFALTILFRSVVVVFMFYVQSIRRTLYASFISLFDGFLGQIPIAYVCCMLMGMDGLWWSFPINSIVLILIIVLYNNVLLKSKRQTAYRNLLLVEKDMDLIMEKSGTEVLTEADDCSLLKLIPRTTQECGVLLSSYMNSLLKGRSSLKLDYLIREYPDRTILDIRTSVNRIVNLEIVPPQAIKVTNEMVLDMNYLRLNLLKVGSIN